MTKRFVIALDQGTTSSRAVLFDGNGKVVDIASRPLRQIYPQPGWVEHDPIEILSTQLGALTELLVATGIEPAEVACLGITNQRETTIVWDRETSQPITNAIGWQCRRTAPFMEELTKASGVAEMIREKTGLVPDAYFSASKLRWILDNIEGAREAAEEGRLAFGTVDTWLLWALTGGEVHATDSTNASRTMLYDIHRGCWDEELLELFDIPASLCPEVRPSSGSFGTTNRPGVLTGIPICGVAGDQQSALFGQCCFSSGEAKNTYGTGCFLLMNTGNEAVRSESGLITTIAASAPSSNGGTPKTEYALEGSVFVAGALIQWLRDQLEFIEDAAETEIHAQSVDDTLGVYVVPAFTGLGAPWWDPDARGIICGLTSAVQKSHIIRAALESLAFQSCDLLHAMEHDSGRTIEALSVDGGACVNNFLMQFQADMLGCAVVRPENVESTAAGAAYLAGLAAGIWNSPDELRELHRPEHTFLPEIDESFRQERLAQWHRAIQRCRSN